MDNLNQMHIPEQNIPKERFPLRLFIFAASVLVLITVSVLGFVMRDRVAVLMGGTPHEEEAVVDQIALMNETMGDAYALSTDGDLQAAQQVLRTLYYDTYDPVVKEQTLLAMARNAARISATESAALYLQLINDQTIRPELRAAATEEIGILYLFEKVVDPSIFLETIFAEEPFRSLEVAASLGEYTKIVTVFDHANSISPRMVASAFNAYYKAKVLWMEHAGQVSAPQIVSAEELDALKLSMESDVKRHTEMAQTAIAAASETARHKSLATALLDAAAIYRAVTQGQFPTGGFSQSIRLLETQHQTITKILEEPEQPVVFDTYNFLYTGQTWDLIFLTVDTLGESLGSETDIIVASYLNFINGPYGADERSRLSDSTAKSIAAVRLLAVKYPDLNAYLPAMEMSESATTSDQY